MRNGELLCNVEELTVDKGRLQIVSIINWGWPDFGDENRTFKKTVKFEYHDLAQFRKELALKLEEACEIFL